jgi:hypothetical protein
MALPVKIASGFGVLEYWSIGVLEKAKAQISTCIGLLITPLLHHSITPGDCRKRGKTIQAPSGGGPKLSPLGPESLVLVRYCL